LADVATSLIGTPQYHYSHGLSETAFAVGSLLATATFSFQPSARRQVRLARGRPARRQRVRHGHGHLVSVCPPANQPGGKFTESVGPVPSALSHLPVCPVPLTTQTGRQVAQ
jgi:hypothetical protein